MGDSMKETIARIAEEIEDAAVDEDTLSPEARAATEARMAKKDARVARMRDEALAALERFDEPATVRWCSLADAIGLLLADYPEVADQDAIIRNTELIATRIAVRAITRREKREATQ
jgi:hypothetical protein